MRHGKEERNTGEGNISRLIRIIWQYQITNEIKSMLRWVQNRFLIWFGWLRLLWDAHCHKISLSGLRIMHGGVHKKRNHQNLARF
jgi:hypothetical protein